MIHRHPHLWLLASLLSCAPLSAKSPVNISFDPPKTMIVIAEVADVRSEPVKHNLEYKYDPLQETQVTKGDRLIVYERKGKWVRVECPNQQEFTHENKWQGYPGWIEEIFLSEDLSLERKTTPPTQLDNELRWQILAEAKNHLGNPYLWGGRSIHNPKLKKSVTGVDCSGLVNFSFTRVGILVPRDAHELWMKARSIAPQDLQPADLVFLAKADAPEKVVHVMIYNGEGMLIEAPQSGERVRVISIKDRLGKNLNEIKTGDTLGDSTTGARIVYFGTFFPENP